ncbi:WxL protein peptidoglycan domain-containing protein [Paenibacillus campinasensis]|uniref:DUF916 domain-containing protein n=1 Tax=Paenibacillus campinasensis TaxID=66347 RepID=A0A268EIZ4_9BACL|nr:DUF916 domain-containing protein [Paenibacillus campinasensis]PAD73079.1 hypothetical protein CHH67_21000 [Paenibacillus campinasensis]
MNYIPKLLKSSFIALIVFLGLGTASPSYAEEPTAPPDYSFWFAPSDVNARNGLGYYREEVKPGEIKEYKFLVKNVEDRTIHLKIYGTDPIPEQNGGKNFKSYNEGVTQAGTWLYPQGAKDITLQPNEMREYTYRVSVPEDLIPGQHIAVVAVTELQQQSHEADANGEVATLLTDKKYDYGLWIILDYQIDKAQHGMSINAFNHDYITTGESRFTVDLENKGTILEQPTGYLEIRDDTKKVIFREDYQAGSIYYGTTAKMVSIALDQILLPGDYEAYFEANFAGQKEWRIFKFTVTPEMQNEAQIAMEHAGKLEVKSGIPDWLKYVLVILGVLILLLLLLLLLKRRKKGDVEALIKKYIEDKGLTFDKARKKVQLDPQTFTLYAVKLGYIQDGEEPEWNRTLSTSKRARQAAIQRITQTKAEA